MKTRHSTKRPPQNVEPASKKAKTITKPKIEFSGVDSNDKVIESLRITYKNTPINRQESINSAVLDNIALEGLEGITFKRLLHLLDAIFPNFKALKDEKCQNYIYSILINAHLKQASTIEAYYVPKLDAKESELSDNKNIITEKPIKLPQNCSFNANSSVIYPVQDGSVMGSCSNYLTRQNITKELIDSFDKHGIKDSLYELHEKYNLDNVYFVASQTLRTNSIYPPYADPNMKIMLREYCTLELIGKSRTLGCLFPNNKSFGRYRIMLEMKNFITEYQETSSHPIEHHLKRFSFVKKDQGFLQQQFRENSCRNLSKDIDLDENKDKENEEVKSNDDMEDDDEEDYEEEDLKISTKNSKLLPSRLCCNPPTMKPFRSILTTVYDALSRAPDGLTQLDLRKILNLPKYHVRNHLKNLISLKLVCCAPKSSDNPFRKYKTYHRRRTKHRLVRKGIMAKWDDRDIKARRFLGKKRSSFTQAEDTLLILCRIACVLVKPDTRLSWCVHKRVIRNVLHKHFVESHDKTSDACLRRIKYLRKLTGNAMSIDELIVELRDDPEVKALLSNKKYTQPTDDKKKANRNLNRLFLAMVEIVRSRAPNLLGVNKPELTPPDTIKAIEFNSTSMSIEYFTKPIEVNSYRELKENYEIQECSTVACSRQQKYQTSSLLKLATRVGKNYSIDIDENNEMPSFALLTSIFSHFSVNQQSADLELTLKLPPNIVGIDPGNNNFKGLCDKMDETTKNIIAKLMRQPSSLSPLALTAFHKCGSVSDCLVVQPCNVRFHSGKKLNSSYGNSSLGKYSIHDIESVLSWVIVCPGIELDNLRKEFDKDLIDIVMNLNLITQKSVRMRLGRPRLFGYEARKSSREQITIYEALPDAYVKYCQLLESKHYRNEMK